jgi:hypothetical protein
MLSSKKLKLLLNGGGTAVSVEAEITALTHEMDGYRRELGEMPLRRAELIMSDDSNLQVDKMEARERQLYRDLEKADLQLAALHTKLDGHRNIGRGSRIKHHRAALIAAASNVEKAIEAAIVANAAAFEAFDAASRELGSDNANRLMPMVHFAGLVTSECLDIWRSQLETQTERVSRNEFRTAPVQHRCLFL